LEINQMTSYAKAGAAGLFLAACAFAGAAQAKDVLSPAYAAQALADPRRPAAEVARDPARKPAEVIAFAGVKPGDKVADVYIGGGYYSRILSAVVGPAGHVYGVIPAEMARNCTPTEFAGGHVLEHDARYRNVSVMVQPAVGFATPEPLDTIISSQNYHDLYDRFMEHADVAAIDRAFYRALKPGGVLLIVDHAAEAGSGIRDTETRHRIDPERIRRDLEAAGFVFVGESEALRNREDDHSLRVFDPRIRGRTDQVILKFRRPATA
jgi:predicted methyltransferase